METRAAPVDLIDLDLVTAVAETGSITHGAARARLSLPSASGRIRSLEHTLGVTLFDPGRTSAAPPRQVRVPRGRSAAHGTGRVRAGTRRHRPRPGQHRRH